MHQTTYGETPNKTRIYSGDLIKDFIAKEKETIKSFNKKSCVYSKDTFIKDSALNYLNKLPENEFESSIKNIILKEYKDCEKSYPFLGSYFLYRFFNITNTPKNRKSFKFHKSYETSLIESLDYQINKEIAKWIFNNISLERNLKVDYHKEKDILVDVVDDFVINIEYDNTFYQNNQGLNAKNYRFIIIDGMIESVSEIHHLMFKANETKEPYVIFCHGMSEEVKYNILKNNKEGRTQVLPVDINFNENTLNVLNDLAVIHDDYVVSSKMGQTISQEVSKELSVGKSISFYKNKLIIEAVADKHAIKVHRNFLRKRIEEGESKKDVNVDVLKNRLKYFSAKNVNVFIPEKYKHDKSFLKELDYFLRVISNLNQYFIVKDFDFKRKYFVPFNSLMYVEKKVKNTAEIISSIEKLVVS